MDVDWCFCGRKAEGKTPYCSDACLTNDIHSPFLDYDSPSSLSDSRDDDESSRHHHRGRGRSQRPLAPRPFPTRWAGTGREGILAWAKDIPACHPESSDHIPPSPKFRPPTFPLTRQRPVPPALSMSTTQPARTKSTPIAAPQASGSHSRESEEQERSGSFNSLVSALTDSVATPQSADKHGVGLFGGLTSKLRTFGNGNTNNATSPQQHPKTGKPAAGAIPTAHFAVLTTTHPLHSDLLYPVPVSAGAAKWVKEAAWDSGEHPNHNSGTVWISQAKAQGYAARVRPKPVTFPVQSDAEHLASLARGRKFSRPTPVRVVR